MQGPPEFDGVSSGSEYVRRLGEAAHLPKGFMRASRPLSSYYSAAQNTYQQAMSYKREGDVERTYFLYMRFASLLVEHLPSHPHFLADSDERRRDQFRLRAGQVMDAMQPMKKIIRQRFEERRAAALAPPPSPHAPPALSYPAVPAPSVSFPVAAVSGPAPPSSTVSVFPLPPGSTSVGDHPRTRHVVVHGEMFTEFMRAAGSNTARDIETCGVLCGVLRQGDFHLTTVLIPKQKGTKDTCAMTEAGEGDVFNYQMSHDLLTLGWVHTHPTQKCFLSAVDLHTHLSYQLSLDEAISIVIAPKFQPNFGIFNLTPSGLQEIKSCNLRGFHPHSGSVYQHSPHAKLEWKQPKDWSVIDLR